MFLNYIWANSTCFIGVSLHHWCELNELIIMSNKFKFSFAGMFVRTSVQVIKEKFSRNYYED